MLSCLQGIIHYKKSFKRSMIFKKALGICPNKLLAVINKECVKTLANYPNQWKAVYEPVEARIFLAEAFLKELSLTRV